MSTSDSQILDKRLLICRKSSSISKYRRKECEKIPYFIDEVRERDRIRRKYEATPNIPPRKYSSSSSRSHCKSLNRQYSPPKRRTSISRNRNSVDITIESRKKSRSNHSTQRNSKYPHRSEDRERSGHLNRRSHLYSRSRTRSRTCSRGSAYVTHPPAESNRREQREYQQEEHYDTSNTYLGERNVSEAPTITIPVSIPAGFLNSSYNLSLRHMYYLHEWNLKICQYGHCQCSGLLIRYSHHHMVILRHTQPFYRQLSYHQRAHHFLLMD